MKLLHGSKYGDARRAVQTSGPGGLHASGASRERNGARPASATAGARPFSGVNILIPQGKMLIDWGEFMWKELREGGLLQRYLAREKGTTTQRYRGVAKAMHGTNPHARRGEEGEWRLKAAVPARDFFRWREVDPNFFDDDSNLKSLRRDNPDVCVYD